MSLSLSSSSSHCRHYLKWISSLFLIFSVWFLTVDAQSSGIALEYDFLEESPIGSFVGNVKEDSNLTLRFPQGNAERIRFHLRHSSGQGQQRHLTVDEKTGEIRIVQVIDREKLCPYQLTCDLGLDISVRWADFYETIKVVVHVLDVNDHSPVFPKEEITLNIRENSPPGSLIMIPTAEDADSGILGVQEYRILSDTDGIDALSFELVVTDQVDGAKDVRLKLVEQLDREEVDQLSLTIIAIDGGNPQKSGSIDVTVIILDANDNSPQFEKTSYEVEIEENRPISSTLIQVKATDPDSGPNGIVVFSWAEHTELSYGKIFGIEERTGNVYLKSIVDYEQHQTFLLTVKATDLGSGSLPAFARVIVNVLDINDNSPQISVNVLTDSDFAQVKENASPGTFVAHAAVKDADAGNNGDVDCFIDNPSLFQLEAMYGSEYKIVTAVTFDREEMSDYDVTLTCRDEGEPALTSRRIIYVTILDENDNDPKTGFSSDPFELSLSENNAPNSQILKINATDLDEGRNGALIYRIQPFEGTPGRVLLIDPIVGRLTTLMAFDYELRSRYEFLLTVSDRGDEPRSATATIVLMIIDTNDEQPTFDRSTYYLSVKENQSPDTIVGSVNATDADSTLEFRQITYEFSPPNGHFEINKDTGVIRTLRRLDREEHNVYNLQVVARNRGFQGMQTNVNVTVFIEDENDNAPVFLFPDAGGKNVELAGGNLGVGSVVTRLIASDDDDGRNAELTYYINSGNVENVFDINPMTGVIVLAKQVPVSASISYRLVVAVRDNGVPEMMSVGDLNIAVNNSQGFPPFVTQSNMHVLLEGNNILILVGAALGLIIVLTCIVVAVVCVRRHRRRAKARRFMDSGSGGCCAVHSVQNSHQHCKSPSCSTRVSRGFGSFASTAETNSMRSGGGGCQHIHVCDACDGGGGGGGGGERDGEDETYIDRIPAEWPLQQDSGIIDNCPTSMLDVLPPQLTPTSTRGRMIVSRSIPCSPHSCYSSHSCCSHGPGSRCASAPHRLCRIQQSPSFRSKYNRRQTPETIQMLQTPAIKAGEIGCRDRDHDLESVCSGSTWTDSGRGPSEEDDRTAGFRSLQQQQQQQQQQTTCLNCSSNLNQNEQLNGLANS